MMIYLLATEREVLTLRIPKFFTKFQIVNSPYPFKTHDLENPVPC